MISTLVIRNTPSAIVELVANSYDADASIVRIEYNPEKGLLTIQDDGSGMTPSDLKGFYRLGDSPKLAEPTSSGGRTRIGKFGVATILLKYLSKEYILTTVKDGIETVVHEKFDGSLSPDDEIPFVTSDTKKESGTIIAMRKLNFTESGIDLRSLRRMVQWELPLIRGFTVYVNDEEVIPKSITNATQFRVDETGKDMGHVHGSIYFTGRGTKMHGIHVYVNGRRVGDPVGMLQTFTHRRLIADKIVGVLDANGLEDAILFDRGRFRDDHPGYIQLTETLRRALNAVDRYVSVASTRNQLSRVEGQRGRMLEKAKFTLINAGMPELSKDTLVEFSDDAPQNEPGFYDKESGALLLNPRYPSIVVNQQTTVPAYHQLLVDAIIDTISSARIRSNGASSIEDFLKEKGNIYAGIAGNKEVTVSEEAIHPMIVYTISDVLKHSGFTLGGIRHVLDRGLMHEDENGGILGKDYLAFDSRTKGMIPLHDIVHARYKTGVTVVLPKFEKIFSEIRQAAEPFVRNLGTAVQPCYFVEQTCAGWVTQTLQSDDMDLRRTDANPAHPFETEKSTYLTLPSLAKHIEGLGLQEVSKVIDYAKKNDIEIRQKREGQGVQFNFGDVIVALQYMRGNIERPK